MLKQNNKIQEINLSLCQQISKRDIMEILKVKKLDRSYYILRMNKIKKIDAEVAKLVATGSFNEIELKSLNKIEDKALTHLAGMNSALDLGLSSLNITQAEILLNNKAALLLSNLKTVSIDVAKILSRYQGNILELPSLKNIHPKAFENLNQFKGEFLVLGLLRQK
ncbi:hypothetical protein [Sediminibacterium sp.]|uniref:hypothetical protein n=1 Tax=Sediminibacterium sp. TaxID=1917865 RepID=UPI003F7093B1